MFHRGFFTSLYQNTYRLCILSVIVCIVYSCVAPSAMAQSTPASTEFLLEAFAFQSPDSTGSDKRLSRVDVFVTVPFETIQFSKTQNNTGAHYVGQYRLVITAIDSTHPTPIIITKDRIMTAQTLSATLGATAEFDNTQTVLQLPPGDYTITAEIVDELAQRSLKRSRSLTVLDLRDYDYAMSSIMLASSIVQNKTRFSITPYLNDNITKIVNEPVFGFFELYNNTKSTDSLDILCEIINPKTRKVVGSSRTRKSAPQGTSQQFVQLPITPQSPAGTFGVRFTALTMSADSIHEDKDIRAVTERIIKIEWASDFAELPAGIALEKAIRQLRYVAIPSQIDSILTASTEEERQRRFYEFWKRYDPTPETQRNEAYEEYYQRINYANLHLRSYSEGWQTDMGMVYVIFGQPMNVGFDNFRPDGRTVEIWYYATRRFVFEDFGGFRDFRLRTPVGGEKYRFNVRW